MSEESVTNEQDRTPNEIQQEVNESQYFGITEDFEGWYIKGTYNYIWKLKKLTSAGLKPIRDKEAEYEKKQDAAEKGLIQAYVLEDASDQLAKDIFTFGLENFIDEDWTALNEDAEISRRDISDCAMGLFLFLMRITTKRAAMRLAKPLKGAPNISDINRAYRKSTS